MRRGTLLSVELSRLRRDNSAIQLLFAFGFKSCGLIAGELVNLSFLKFASANAQKA
jgi:hypothetical protein